MKITLDLSEFSAKLREMIATESSSNEILTELSKDENWGVRNAVAKNPNAKLKI